MSGEDESDGRVLGVILSGSTTRRAEAQILRGAESRIREGMLVGIEAWRGERLVLARVEAVRIESDVQRLGGVWDAVRAENPDVLEQLASLETPIVVVELEILGFAGERGLPPIPRPPYPGDKVVELRGVDGLFGVRRGDAGIVWYGSLFGYSDAPIPLDVEAITMHIGVFGETGSGKSYGVGYLLELLSRIPLGGGEEAALPALVIDANADYVDYHEAFLERGAAAGYERVYRFVTPRSRLASRPYTKPLVISLDGFTPREAAEVVLAYKTGGRDMNEMQVSALDRVLSELVEEGYGLTELLTERIGDVYAKLEELSRGREAVIHHQTARAVRAALDKFHREVYKTHGILGGEPTLDENFIDEITAAPSLTIIDFSADGAPGAPLQVKQLIVAYVARLLYSRFTSYKVRGEERYLVFVIEEAQNYAPNLRTYPIGMSVARDYLALLATQGRKFGISLVMVSQRPAFIDPVVLSMINTWVVHRLPPDDVGYVARAAGGLPRDLEARLTSLPRGVALVAGQMNVLGHPVLVKVGSRSVPHRMGSTRIVEHLRRLRRGSRGARGGGEEGGRGGREATR